MSYYDGPSWQGPGRQASWDQPSTPRSASSGGNAPREETNAFLGQFEEVERAIDNLSKSGKAFPMAGGRRDGPMQGGMGRGFGEFQDPRMGGSRHHSMDFDPMRSQSGSNLQNFYANQRFQPRGHGDNDQMHQAKRRMAAQRERELRNYHQEQQYNRSVVAEMSSQGKSETSNSPNLGGDDDRRDSLPHQHRGLYGNDNFYEGPGPDGPTPRPLNQPAPPNSGRGPSPMGFGNFGPEGAGNTSAPTSGALLDDAAKGPSPKPTGPRSRSNSTSSPASAHNPQNYSLFETTATAQQSSRTSTSSPGGSPPRSGKGGAPAPIGTRPVNQALNKRATPPAASPLSFGFAPNEAGGSSGNERAGSAASNPPGSAKEGGTGGSGAWGSGSGVWGQGKLGGVQASVWS